MRQFITKTPTAISCVTLYGNDENGKPLDKQKFRIFDRWGNFEYYELHTEETKVTTTKSLAQKYFEAWITLGAAAQRKFDKQAVDLVAHQLREQINALDEKSIAVQEKWQQKAQYSDEKMLRQLSPKTQQDLLSVLTPLMQWLDERGQSDAIRFDSGRKVVWLAIGAASKNWSKPIHHWRQAMNRFMIESADRMNDYI